MSDQPEAVSDLSMIAAQLQRLTHEIGSLRDDIAVLTALAQRMDNRMNCVRTELRAIRDQQQRSAYFARELEERLDARS